MRATDGTTVGPRGSPGVAWAAWEQERASAGSDFYRVVNLRFGDTPFTLEASDGALRVDGELRGLSDLVDRERVPMPAAELAIDEGDRVTVLGRVTERDGARGFFDDYVVVEGTYGEWYAALERHFLYTLPSPDRPH